MKPLSPHDPLDDLIAAALHGELTPEERAQFELRLSNDPAARAAYQEAQAMHDLLEKTHKSAQPDSAFEQRMVSGVRRKLQSEQHPETAWESVLVLWSGVKGFFTRKRTPMPWLGSAIAIFVIIFVLAGISLGPITHGIKQAKQSQALQIAHQKAVAEYQAQVDAGVPNPVMKSVKAMPDGTIVAYSDEDETKLAANLSKAKAVGAGSSLSRNALADASRDRLGGKDTIFVLNGGTLQNQAGFAGTPINRPSGSPVEQEAKFADADATRASNGMLAAVPAAPPPPVAMAPSKTANRPDLAFADQQMRSTAAADSLESLKQVKEKSEGTDKPLSFAAAIPAPAPGAIPEVAGEPAATDSRKLVRNAQLDLEVKSFQETTDKITQFTKVAGGYVDTSHSEKGGNGKLQGTVVVKVLPQNLDAFLLKLRDLGQVNNQSVSTDDVTKDYYDTQARLENSRRMETQLQDLLKRENGKVSDLLAVERELGRVRGEIEQMQGQLKLYDFQVQYATVTMNISEKDLKQTAAYLLREQDNFSLFATDVEGTFQKARQSAESYKAQILTANLNHNSGSEVSAELVVMVAPDQIESFLGDVRGLGRVANFTRQTQRVAKDGGDSNQPSDQALTEKDKVQVHLAIRSDDESRKQVALTVVAKAVDVALDQAKAAALANPGVEILNSSLNKTPQGESTAQLSVRVPGKEYSTLIDAFNALGRRASLSIQRNDNSGPGASGDDAPVIISLSLSDNDTPLQETEMSVVATNVDAQAQEIKKDAAAAGVEVKASSFERQPDGTELAQMTFRLPMAKYPDFLESVKKLGKVESLSVRRDDRPDQTLTDANAPAEISLQLHNQRGIVAENGGLWSTLRQTFGEGADALFGSIRVIGVAIAYLAPWVFTIALFAWIGRRIYVWRKNK